MVEKAKRVKQSERKGRRAPKRSARKKPPGKTRVRHNKYSRPFIGLLFKVMGFVAVAGFFYILYLDSHIRYEFEGKRWAVPAHVFSRPLELYPGIVLTPDQLERELALLGYHANLSGGRAGSYQRKGDVIRVITRPFLFWDGFEDQLFVRVEFDAGQVTRITDLRGKTTRSLVRLDPYRFATLLPSHNEDRLLLKREQLPEEFVQGLIAVEDRQFYEHHGIDFRGLVRALWVNVTSMQLVQGGSTLTQQLVKNFFLTHERTLTRKAKEAVMASLLEVHYGKNEILEAYANEVYLGQDGKRAVHGFGLGARFYFGEDLTSLPVSDLALLIGIVKGPSYYNPRRYPERALKRRNQVLSIMAEQGVISDSVAQREMAAPLGVIPKGGGVSRFPAFVDLVRQQLARDYNEEDLRSEGLQIFTTLDPLVQMDVERVVDEQLARLEKNKAVDALQAAVVVTATGSGEVLALLGGREIRAAGFNRAIQAKRQVGSLIKPAVYLAALAHHGYTLTSPLNDEPLSLPMGSDESWQPENFDRKFLGSLPLYQGLVGSRNVPTVRLGLDVGVKTVVNELHRLGIDEPLPPYPSLLLGAVELSPLAVTQMYQTFAEGGFYTPLRAIRTIVTPNRDVLQRFPLHVEQVVDPAAVYLVNYALQGVVHEGTAQSMRRYIDPSLQVAGKTGTSNDGRDSWFAGFTGNRLAVVWIGRDDNRSTALTGAQGAMTVWAQLMKSVGVVPLNMPQPSDVERVWVDADSNRRVKQGCESAVELPFVMGSAPEVEYACRGGVGSGSNNWLKGFFQ